MTSLQNWLHIGRMDELGRKDTPIHRLDARAKIITTLLFVVTVMSFPRHALSALTPLALFPLLVMAAGQIPTRDIAVKVLVASPFALIVGMFNPLLDRTPMMSFGLWEISGGWISYASILVRFTLTVSAALVLVATTGMHRLGAGLEQLGMPRVFIMQLMFLHRYLFVVTEEAATMLRSVACRCPSVRALPLGIYGPLSGQLLLRSLDRAGRVHRAMIARGYDGHIRTGSQTRITATDIMFVVAWVAFFFAARRWNLADALGSFLV